MTSVRITCSVFLLLACILAPGVRAESFGTLFTTPEQRALLDNATLPADRSEDADGGTGQGAAAAVQVIRLDGTLVSSLGKRELWVNGKAASDNTPPGVRQARVRDNGLVTIRLDHATASRSLKPGQLYLPDSGEIREAYLNNAQQAQE